MRDPVSTYKAIIIYVNSALPFFPAGDVASS